jgi:hypothetical protein
MDSVFSNMSGVTPIRGEGGANCGGLLPHSRSSATTTPAADSSTSERLSALALADTSSVSMGQEFLLTDRLTGAAYLETRLPSILSVALQASLRVFNSSAFPILFSRFS